MDVLTTTRNHENDGHRIGLHVDNWDKLPYATKHTGRRRICINIGPGTRYLLLGDRDIRSICRALHQDYADRYPHTDDLRRYVGSGHVVLCFRIRLEPGEGATGRVGCFRPSSREFRTQMVQLYVYTVGRGSWAAS